MSYLDHLHNLMLEQADQPIIQLTFTDWGEALSAYNNLPQPATLYISQGIYYYEYDNTIHER